MDEPIDVWVNFDVVDECDDWIVVNKPAPLIVHPTSKKVEPTLLGGLEQLLSFDIQNGARLSIINRLDRETSGLVLVAKRKFAARMFGRAMERRLFEKEYDAICLGWPAWEERSLDAPLLRKGELESSPIWVKQMVHPDGRPSETYFRVVKRGTHRGVKVSLLRVFPKTGRMHQIRVHAAYLGHPLVGDKIYGEDETCYLRYIEGGWSAKLASQLLLKRHALHASRMALTLDEVSLEWEIGLTKDLDDFFDA
ncbi:RluA family pseudouridine synthase [Rubritalea profundi]|uniref:RNA pseudouridine synthase n=1 Tax=Rubritalea profundi TaxID=1658618 RepID=A0A2S7U4C9_9BACT|nr:RNA pseudouridine synthase [Rubritalea profundi]PQJ29367.1 RNA pseudouridine synthase [Rubritalea profundi]